MKECLFSVVLGTQRTPIPWRARTVHSILGSKDTNEKLELEVSDVQYEYCMCMYS